MAAAGQPVPQSTTDEIFIRFPPFPPPGVNITPFKSYKETGIKLICPNGDGVEVDGLNIPTVTLDHRHTTDRCKTDAWRDDYKDIGDPTTPKKRKFKTSAAVNGSIKKEWWQVWQDEEADKHAGPYDRNIPAIDRLCQAANAFRSSRTWPQPDSKQLSAAKLFDQFGIFIGLQAIIPAWIRAERQRAEEALKEFKDMAEKQGQNTIHEEEEGDDDGCDDDDVNEAPIVHEAQAPQEVTTQANAENDPNETVDAETAAIQEEDKRKDDRLLAFLGDPETVVKMFLSSYMLKENLVWSYPNLTVTPRVVFFFFRYVLRNKLLPEYDAALKKALAVAERAQRELPRTSIIVKLVPCEVSLALRDQFGYKVGQFLLQGNDEKGDKAQYKEEGNDNADDADATDMDDVTLELEEAAIEYVGGGEFVDVLKPVQDGGISFAKTEEINGDTQHADVSNGPTKLDQVTDMDVDSAAAAANDDAGEGWGSSFDAWDNQGSWDDAFEQYQQSQQPQVDWTLPVYSLKKFLGVDALPATYTTGVVEESVRKIISVRAPGGKKDANRSANGSLEEDDFEELGRIVLAPWNDWDNPKEGDALDELRRVYTEIYHGKRLEKKIMTWRKAENEVQPGTETKEEATANDGTVEGSEKKDESEKATQRFNPADLYCDRYEYTESTTAKIVWESSTGWVVDPITGKTILSRCHARENPVLAGDSGGTSNNLPDEMPEGERRKAHDPFKDAIEIVVDPKVIDQVKDVIGMGFDGTFVQLVKESPDVVGEGRKTFWYMENLKLVIPGFYTS